MESKRQQKFARLILRDMSEIFQKEGKNILGSSFLTITQVRMTPDLSIARIFLSVLVETEREKVLKLLIENKSAIRNLLATKIRHQVRIIPNLEFFMDDTAEYAAKMTNLINSLEIRPIEDDEDLSENYDIDKFD